MTVEAVPIDRPAPAFSPRTVLALVLVGIVAFSGLAVLGAYAPELRGGLDPGAHALSSSAVGFRGAVVMLRGLDAPVIISRARPRLGQDAAPLIVLTPTIATSAKDLQPFPHEVRKLIILPKWATTPDPRRPTFVRKAGVDPSVARAVAEMLKPYARTTVLERRAGMSRPVLRGGGGPYAGGTYLPLAQIDQLQTLAGDGWRPALADETGRAVLAYSNARPDVLVLADPDLLNNQGLAKLDNARAGMAIVRTLGDGGVIFDVTLNGFQRGRSLGRLMLEPPWLAATLCAVAAAILMGLHGLARFGPAKVPGRAIALGSRALVDNAAGLVRMARKEAAFAPRYVELTKLLVKRAVGGSHAAAEAEDDRWLSELAARRGLARPEALVAEAERARTRGDLLALARKLHRWKGEMLREGG
ncbi:MAG: hypothetical protein JWP50_3059 [Phenylobacterium sp.]|nr:hypothetical protein [Phenylobacterium sp.]